MAVKGSKKHLDRCVDNQAMVPDSHSHQQLTFPPPSTDICMLPKLHSYLCYTLMTTILNFYKIKWKYGCQ